MIGQVAAFLQPPPASPRVRRIVLAVSPWPPEQGALRLWAIQEGWRLLLVDTLEAALELRQEWYITVILYDRDLPDVEWRTGMQRLLTCSEPTCLILMSSTVDHRLWRTVLEYGGYDVAEKPLSRESLVPLVNAACVLAHAVDYVGV